MAELKTKPTGEDVSEFLGGIEPPERRTDCIAVAKMMEAITGEKGRMWGKSMVGFGDYHYRYASGREGDWFITGFSPRKQDLTLYIMSGFAEYDALMARLGKYKAGKSCLYLKRLADVDLKVLRKLIGESVKYMRKTYS